MTRYTEIHNHSVNAVFNPSHKHSNIVFPEKKSFLLWRRDHEKKKKKISHWNKQLPYHESNCFHSLGRQATIQSTRGGFQIVF